MKKLNTFAFFLMIALQLQGQSINVSSYVERTNISPKMGVTVGYGFKDQIEVGGFYQKSSLEFYELSNRSKFYEKDFMGFYFNYPLVNSRLAIIKFNIRTGVSNGENFVITPSILAHYKLMKVIEVGAGIGTRAFRPTFQASIRVKLLR